MKPKSYVIDAYFTGNYTGAYRNRLNQPFVAQENAERYLKDHIGKRYEVKC